MSQPFTPIVGKNVIETLTLGMYENPHFIYREYIQNSADQIDVAVEEGILNDRSQGYISVEIDELTKKITIEDNATGIKSAQIRRFLGDVANSEKDPNKRKGFRGIGRLGGLGYCEKLIFETSYQGEKLKTTMTLDAKQLKEIIENKQDNSDAASVISIITDIDPSDAPSNSHYFKVILENVTNNVLLNVELVKTYLSMVAPVPFSPKFTFGSQIKKHFQTRNFLFDEYRTTLNGHPLYKAYKNKLKLDKDPNEEIPITSIGFFDVLSENSQLLGIGWYGISLRLNEMIDKINPERGIRIRKGNITIGDEKTLFPRFRADRTNLRYIGEIHTIGDGFIPNARRDYFNDNKTIEQFEDALTEIFKDFENKLPHKASDLHNRLDDIKEFKQTIEAFKRDQPKFKTETEANQRRQEVKAEFEAAKNAVKKINKIKEEADTNPQLKSLFENIVGEYDYKIPHDGILKLDSKRTYPPLRFSKVSAPQAKILNEVVVFLQNELGYTEAEDLIRKLQKKYN